MSIEKLSITVTAIPALRAALTISRDDKSSTPFSIDVAIGEYGVVQELYASDYRGIVFVPIQQASIRFHDRKTVHPLRLAWDNIMFPLNTKKITFDLVSENGKLVGIVESENGSFRSLVTTTLSPLPTPRSIVPEELTYMDVAHPAGYDTIEVAKILRASGKDTSVQSAPVKLVEGYGFEWKFPTGGNLVYGATPTDAATNKKFTAIYRTTTERSPF